MTAVLVGDEDGGEEKVSRLQAERQAETQRLPRYEYTDARCWRFD